MLKSALGPLTKLEDLHLGIFLSSEELFYDHLEHAISYEPAPISAPSPTSDPETILPSPAPSSSSPICNTQSTSPQPTTQYQQQQQQQPYYQASPTKPSGPEWCIQCFEMHAKNVRLCELQATLALAQTLKGLKSVMWASWFGRQRQEMEGRRTRVWVSRLGSKIRVRRRSWEEKK